MLGLHFPALLLIPLALLALPPTVHATGPLISEPVTFESIESYLRTEPSASMEDLLSALPETYRRSFTLMHASESLQEASAENPRVIMFGADASLVLAFNGDPTQRGYNRLEMIQFRRDRAAFEMREVEFSALGPAFISKANPTRCLSCHQADPRPNWNHYPTWPGAIGADDDRLEMETPAVKEGLEALFKKAPQHARYRHLPQLEASYRLSDSPMQSSRSTLEHNITFTQRLSAHNFRRLARLLRATADYERYRFSIVAALQCPQKGFANFFPDHLRELYADAIRNTEAIGSSPLGPGAFTFVLNARGIATHDYSMGFLTKGQQFTTPGIYRFELSAVLVENDPEMKPLFRYEPYQLTSGFAWNTSYTVFAKKTEDTCARLMQLSVNALSR